MLAGLVGERWSTAGPAAPRSAAHTLVVWAGLLSTAGASHNLRQRYGARREGGTEPQKFEGDARLSVEAKLWRSRAPGFDEQVQGIQFLLESRLGQSETSMES